MISRDLWLFILAAIYNAVTIIIVITQRDASYLTILIPTDIATLAYWVRFGSYWNDEPKSPANRPGSARQLR